MKSEKTYRRSAILRSLWHIDLWLALLGSGGVAIASWTIDFEPKREWIMPISAISFGMMSILLQRLSSLRKKLAEFAYGELVHLDDDRGIEVGLPYWIGICVSLISMIISAVVVVTIESVDNMWLRALMLTTTSLFALWTILAFVSLIRLAEHHDANTTEIEKMRRTTEADQRRYKAAIYRRRHPNS